MQFGGVTVEDTFAEAFPMWAARLVVTARDLEWAMTAARVATGMATSVIGCGAEAGVEGPVAETPDGRPGVSLLVFAPSREALARELVRRVGQAIMTCPTTACFDGLAAGGEALPPGGPTEGGGAAPEVHRVPLGRALRLFGDGYQTAKRLGGRRYNRIPVMDGEFLVEDSVRAVPAVGGGNFLVLGAGEEAALEAAAAAVRAIREQVRGVILPFPGGIVRAGSKVGSRYRNVPASTNHRFCPTLRARVEDTALPEGVGAVYEVVIDGLSLEAVTAAVRVGVRAACRPGVLRITAGNYGGRLGPYRIDLWAAVAGEVPC